MTEHPIDRLRKLVILCNNMRESFNQQFEAKKLLRLYDMYAACGHDIAPDKWTPVQVYRALEFGECPQFLDELASSNK